MVARFVEEPRNFLGKGLKIEHTTRAMRFSPSVLTSFSPQFDIDNPKINRKASPILAIDSMSFDLEFKDGGLPFGMNHTTGQFVAIHVRFIKAFKIIPAAGEVTFNAVEQSGIGQRARITLI
jgi:hypothetical protein